MDHKTARLAAASPLGETSKASLSTELSLELLFWAASLRCVVLVLDVDRCVLSHMGQ